MLFVFILFMITITLMFIIYTNKDNYTSAQPPPPLETNTGIATIRQYPSYRYPVQGVDCTMNCNNYNL